MRILFCKCFSLTTGAKEDWLQHLQTWNSIELQRVCSGFTSTSSHFYCSPNFFPGHSISKTRNFITISCMQNSWLTDSKAILGHAYSLYIFDHTLMATPCSNTAQRGTKLDYDRGDGKPQNFFSTWFHPIGILLFGHPTWPEDCSSDWTQLQTACK